MAEARYSFLTKKFFVFLGLGLAVFLGLSLYGNWPLVAGAFKGFSYALLPVILFLVFLNYLSRYWRWELYLKRVGISLPGRESFTIFMSGLVMTVTPGKMGELIKSVLLKEGYEVAISRSAPVVLAERFTDLLAVYVLALAGSASFAFGTKTLWLGTGFLIAGLLPFVSGGTFRFCLKMLERIPWGSRLRSSIPEAFHTLHDLMGFRILFWASVIGIMAWFFECLAFFLVFHGLGWPVPLAKATFIYAFAALAGALSMLPGGIGAAEASMTGLLLLIQVPKAQAATATILIRVCTVWFAVLLGYGFLRLFQGRLRP
jgi:glycosyltransferase 2 family protein